MAGTSRNATPQIREPLSELPDAMLHSKLLELEVDPQPETENKEAWDGKSSLKFLKSLVASKKKRDEQEEKTKAKLQKQRDLAMKKDQPEETALSVNQALEDAKALAQLMQPKQAADPEPTSVEAVLQSVQVPNAPDLDTVQLPGALAQLVQHAVSAAQTGAAASQGVEASQKVVLKHLLISGQLAEHLHAFSAWDAPICRMLFETMAYSSNEHLAVAAQRALLRGICDLDFTAIGAVEAAYSSSLYRRERTCALQWLPTARDFLAVLEAYGYPAQGRAGRSTKAAAAATATPAASAADGNSWLPSRLVNLQLVLRMLAVLCELALGGRGGVDAGQLTAAAGATPLLAALLHLHIDQQCGAVLFPDLQRCTEALMNAVDERSWARMSPDLAAQVADMGPSHRAQLRIICGVPYLDPHGKLLRQQAAMALLRKILEVKTQGRHGVAVSLDELPTLLGEERNMRDLERKLSRGPDKKLDCWLVHTVVKLADAVLWPEVQSMTPGQGNEELREVVRWFMHFLKNIGRHVRGITLGAIEVKRIVAELQNSYLFTCPDDWTNA